MPASVSLGGNKCRLDSKAYEAKLFGSAHPRLPFKDFGGSVAQPSAGAEGEGEVTLCRRTRETNGRLKRMNDSKRFLRSIPPFISFQ